MSVRDDTTGNYKGVADSDVLLGGGGDDQLIGDDDTWQSGGSTERGDWLSGENGNDALTGSNRSDALLGGAGKHRHPRRWRTPHHLQARFGDAQHLGKLGLTLVNQNQKSELLTQ